ncbi:MAG: hypothetical protein AAB576_06750, partial [Elusimicrobiota bacterium]
RKCEESSNAEKTGKGNAQYGKNLMNEFQKASDQYLKEIKGMGRAFGGGLAGVGQGYGGFPGSLFSDLPKECGDLSGGEQQGNGIKQGLEGEFNTAKGKCDRASHTHPCSGRGCRPTRHTSCRPCDYGGLYTDELKKKARRDVFKEDFDLCKKHAGIIGPKCQAVNDAIDRKRVGAECESAGSEYTMSDVAKETPHLKCDKLVWNSSTQGRIFEIVQQQNLGRDKNFTVVGEQGGEDWQ